MYNLNLFKLKFYFNSLDSFGGAVGGHWHLASKREPKYHPLGQDTTYNKGRPPRGISDLLQILHIPAAFSFADP